MTLKLRVSQRLSKTKPGSLSFNATGLENDWSSTWYILGFKRSTGAPATMADFAQVMPFTLLIADRGTFQWGTAPTGTATGVFALLTAADNFPTALEGDHVWFSVVYGGAEPPISSDSFVTSIPLGTLRA